MGDKNVKKTDRLHDKNWRGECMVFVPIYNEQVILFVGSQDQALNYFDARAGMKNIIAKVRLSENCGAMATTTFGNGQALIMIPELDLHDMKCVTSLFHEALHVAMIIADRTGIEIGKYGEVIAYLQEYIVKSLLREIEIGRCYTLNPDGTVDGPDPSVPENENILAMIPDIEAVLKANKK